MMNNFINPIIELAVILPGLLLTYLPMKHHLHISKAKLAVFSVLTSILLCVIGGSLCYFFKIGTIWVTIPILIITAISYQYTLKITPWKSISVLLAVCGSFSCINGVARAIDALLCPDNLSLWFGLGAGLIYNILCWMSVIISWYPATHAACDLLEDDSIAQTWYLFWILPTVFFALNLFMIPIIPGILYQGRILQIYIVVSLILLALLMLFYALFYLIAKSLNKNNRLKQENQFLSMQQTQYETLCSAIEETRQARHDMRHHFSTIATLTKRRDWQELEYYLAQAQEAIPDIELNLCDNPAVDAVIGHYAVLYKINDIPFSTEFDLPHKLPITEMELCLVLSNLLENALEASICTKPEKRHIRAQAYLHSNNIVLLTVENTFDGVIEETNGILQSTKRRGNGIGVQSVRRIAEKNGGYCNIIWKNNVFCANILLRGEQN